MPKVHGVGAWRGGTESRSRTRKEMLLKVWSTESSQRFGSDGKAKTGKRAPKPVSLAKITWPKESEG